MANLALACSSHKGEKETRVLDPCCGSGSLLLYAAALGASQLVGADSDSTAWARAEDEFERHIALSSTGTERRKSALAKPKFIEGDIFNPTNTAELSGTDSYNAIITDPPYNVGAPILVNRQDFRRKSYHRKEDSMKPVNEEDTSSKVVLEATTVHILKLAGRLLVNGGRLLFFIPVKGNREVSVAKRYETTIQLCGLNILFERMQRFSPTFSRWLVCLEKRVDSTRK